MVELAAHEANEQISDTGPHPVDRVALAQSGYPTAPASGAETIGAAKDQFRRAAPAALKSGPKDNPLKVVPVNTDHRSAAFPALPHEFLRIPL